MSAKTAPPKHIIISHVYSSENKGDAALTSVLIQDIKRTFRNAHITILKLDSLRESRFEGVLEKPSFMAYVLNAYTNPLVKLAYALYMMCATLLWALLRRVVDARFLLPRHLRDIVALYDTADLIVPVGGGYIRSRKGLKHAFNVPLLLHPLLLGSVLGKTTVLYAQSVGPFHSTFEERLVMFVLGRMSLIMLREDTSVALLARLGVRYNVVRAIDSGFLLEGTQKINLRKMYGIPKDRLLIGVTVRAWLDDAAQATYEDAMARALDAVIESQGVHVVFIPQVTAAKGDDDRIVSERVRGRMRHLNNVTLITDTPDHHTIKSLYDNLDVLLGTRFHSVIFSLTSHVPVLAIEYEHKTSGIMRDLRLQNWVIKIEDVTADNVTKALQKLLHDHIGYRIELTKIMPPYVEKAKASAALLAETYSR